MIIFHSLDGFFTDPPSHHAVGPSQITLPLTTHPHTYTQTHASTDHWGPPEAPQGLIHSGVWVSMAWIRVMHWIPHSPLLAPSPHSCASSGSFHHHFHTSTGITWLLLLCVCVCVPGELCLNKSCLRLVLSTAAEVGGEAFRSSAAKLKKEWTC